MRDNTDKVFLIVATTVTLLLLLHWVPPVKVGGYHLQSVDLLDQLTDTSWRDAGHAGILESSWRQDSLIPYLEDYTPDHAMTAVIAGLDTLANQSRPMRIAVFGDSFIEGDILLGELRELLQTRYGGSGVGWVDAGNEQTSFRTTFWAKSTGFSEHMAMLPEQYDAKRAGIAMRYYTIADKKATFSGHGVKTYPHAMQWETATLYLRSSSGATVTSSIDGTPFSCRVTSDSVLQSVELPVSLADTLTPMHVSFQIHGDADVYGIALESRHGLVIDNLSMRGESGIKLGRLSDFMLKEFQRVRPYDLLILQYGANVIDATTTEDDLYWFRRAMAHTIARLKQCFPSIPIVVVSTPDRGNHINSSVTTMSSVPMLVNFQRRLAQEHQVAFYNLYEAMGGANAIAHLHSDGCCNSDLIHLNIKGGRVVAHRLFDNH